MKSIPPGVYPTMITPFDDNMQVDLTALAIIVNWYEQNGSAGLFALCASSETSHLNFDEQLQILREILRVKQPGTVILASGSKAANISAQIEQARPVIAEGIDCYVFITNWLAAQDEDDDVLLRNLERITSALGDAVPFGFYEAFGPYNRQLTPYVIERLGSIGNFVYLKDTSCDIAKIKAKLEAAKASGLQIFNANTATLRESLQAGCAGYSGVMGNFHPQLYAKMCEIYATEQAGPLQEYLDMAFAMRCAYPADAKYYLQLEGLPVGCACRSRDNSTFGSEQKEKMRLLRQKTQVFEKI